MSDYQWCFDNPQEAADLIEQQQQRIEELEAQGLTKREQFAMAAMQGILSGYGSGDVSHGGVAWDAIKCADALLDELASGKE